MTTPTEARAAQVRSAPIEVGSAAARVEAWLAGRNLELHTSDLERLIAYGRLAGVAASKPKQSEVAIRWALVQFVTALQDREAEDRKNASAENGWRMSSAHDLYDDVIDTVMRLSTGSLDAVAYLEEENRRYETQAESNVRAMNAPDHEPLSSEDWVTKTGAQVQERIVVPGCQECGASTQDCLQSQREVGQPCCAPCEADATHWSPSLRDKPVAEPGAPADPTNPLHPKDLANDFHQRTGRCTGLVADGGLHTQCARIELAHIHDDDHRFCLPGEDGFTEVEVHQATLYLESDGYDGPEISVGDWLRAHRSEPNYVTAVETGEQAHGTEFVPLTLEQRVTALERRVEDLSRRPSPYDVLRGSDGR